MEASSPWISKVGKVHQFLSVKYLCRYVGTLEKYDVLNGSFSFTKVRNMGDEGRNPSYPMPGSETIYPSLVAHASEIMFVIPPVEKVEKEEGKVVEGNELEEGIKNDTRYISGIQNGLETINCFFVRSHFREVTTKEMEETFNDDKSVGLFHFVCTLTIPKSMKRSDFEPRKVNNALSRNIIHGSTAGNRNSIFKRMSEHVEFLVKEERGLNDGKALQTSTFATTIQNKRKGASKDDFVILVIVREGGTLDVRRYKDEFHTAVRGRARGDRGIRVRARGRGSPGRYEEQQQVGGESNKNTRGGGILQRGGRRGGGRRKNNNNNYNNNKGGKGKNNKMNKN